MTTKQWYIRSAIELFHVLAKISKSVKKTIQTIINLAVICVYGKRDVRVISKGPFSIWKLCH